MLPGFYGLSWEKNQTISEIPVPISIDRKKIEFENITSGGQATP